MDEDILKLLDGLVEVAETAQERAKVYALRDRWLKEGPDAIKKFLHEEPMVLRLLDKIYGEEAVDIALMKAADEMGVDLDELKKKLR
jgi:hypothetical protein